jgi:putative tricarboxylic transport membrane protein
VAWGGVLRQINTDTVVASLLLVFCGVFLKASFDIPDMGYESMGAEVWPRIVLFALAVLSAVYLFRSVRQGAPETNPEADPRPCGLLGRIGRYQNALWCYGLFLIFLLSLDYLGMLIGGVLLVFGILTALGRRGLADQLRHAAIALVSMGAMWSIFTFGLKVFLPEGEILKVW